MFAGRNFLLFDTQKKYPFNSVGLEFRNISRMFSFLITCTLLGFQVGGYLPPKFQGVIISKILGGGGVITPKTPLRYATINSLIYLFEFRVVRLKMGIFYREKDRQIDIHRQLDCLLLKKHTQLIHVISRGGLQLQGKRGNAPLCNFFPRLPPWQFSPFAPPW